MHRRDVLAALAGSLGAAGCLGSPGPAADEDTPTGTASPAAVTGRTGTASPIGTPASPFPRRIAVDGVDDAALRRAFDVAADVSVPDPEVTAGETARVALALRTTVDDARQLVYEQDDCGRNDLAADRGDLGLLLFPAGGDWTVEGADCPVVTRPNLDCGIPVVEATAAVPATGSLTWRYEVVVPPRNVDRGRCVAPGRYRFARRFEAGDAAATLAFVLSVTAP